MDKAAAGGSKLRAMGSKVNVIKNKEGSNLSLALESSVESSNIGQTSRLAGGPGTDELVNGDPKAKESQIALNKQFTVIPELDQEDQKEITMGDERAG